MMDLPVSAWHQAVIFRKSRRSFIPGRPVAEDQLARLERLSRDFRPFPGARFEIVRRAPDTVLRGLVGGYGRITGAPAYAVMIGSASDPGAAVRVGYTGEGLILEATALGLATCWVSGMFKNEEVRKSATRLGRRARLCDHPARSRGTRFLLEGKDVHPRGRVAQAEIHGGSDRGVLSPALAGRGRRGGSDRPLGTKPPALEVRPVARSSITVRRDSGPDGERYPKSLDCGIAMLHLELGRPSRRRAPATWTLPLPAGRRPVRRAIRIFRPSEIPREAIR